jgi:Rrf2 family protein
LLSCTSDYALRAVLVLAGEYLRRPLRADEIATATGAPRNYMSKTLNALVKAGLLKSARGPMGGFSLAIAPGSLTIARVIDCFDEPRPRIQCLLGGRACDSNNPCAAHETWTRINARRSEPFATTTIADLAGFASGPSSPEPSRSQTAFPGGY